MVQTVHQRVAVEVRATESDHESRSFARRGNKYLAVISNDCSGLQLHSRGPDVHGSASAAVIDGAADAADRRSGAREGVVGEADVKHSAGSDDQRRLTDV